MRATATTLATPTPEGMTAMMARFFDESGLTRETVLEAVTLLQRRTEVFNDDALAVFEESGAFRSACGAGCGFCCHTLVSVLPPEAFGVAEHVAGLDAPAREAFEARVREADRRYRGWNGAQRYAGRAACPFLDPKTWLCGLHEARPLVCRAMHSGDLPACKKAYAARDPEVPTVSMRAFFDNREACHAGWVGALRPRGLQCDPLELNAALVTIWDGEDVMARWLEGEPVFGEARLSRAA